MEIERTSGEAAPPLARELILRAEAMVPRLQDRAARAEKARSLPVETVAELRDADFFRILQPARVGGYELDYTVLARISWALAKGCGSTAWVCGLAAMHQWIIAKFPIEAQEEVWGPDPGAVAFGSYAATTPAHPADGGYRLTGNGLFASGCDHGQWGLLGAMFPPADGDGPARPGFALIPASDYSIRDDWHTVGLAATGSKSLVVDDVFVPAHRTVTFAELASPDSPGCAVNTAPLYRIPMLSVIPVTIGCPTVGILEAAIESFVAATRERGTRGAVVSGGRRMAEFASVQTRLAEATAALDATKLIWLRDLEETHAMAARGEPITLDIRLRNRRTQSYTVKLASDAIDGLYGVTGGFGIYLSDPIQRAWRDIHAAAHHVSLNWDAVSTMYGQHLLGLEPQGQY